MSPGHLSRLVGARGLTKLGAQASGFSRGVSAEFT